MTKEDLFQQTGMKHYDRKQNEKFIRKFESRVNEGEFLEHFRTPRNLMLEPTNLPSDSECSIDSTKVETDSVCLEDDDFPPTMIQDFRYDDSGNQFEDSFVDSNLNAMGRKDDAIGLDVTDMNSLSRSRTSTKRDDSGSLDVLGSTENSLAGSLQDVSDDATISDSESMDKLRKNLHSKVS